MIWLWKAFKETFSRLVPTLAILLGLSQTVNASNEHGRGLKNLTQQQIEQMEQNWQHVIGVRPNKLGAARIEEHLKRNNLAASAAIEPISSFEEEYITVNGSEASFLDQEHFSLASPQLPSHVDNSVLPSFPPIGNQHQLGSCVGWASTYYQASHEIGLLNGINNKTSFNGVLSPKWTYNSLNGGQDGGLIITDAYRLLSINGAPSIEHFPYDTNYLSWDLNTQDWVAAMSNRTAPALLISGAGNQPQNLQVIKQLLNNGHILTFGTYVDSWVFTTVGKDPSNPSSPYTGQQAVSWMNGYNGGHHITIVGYDDNVWIDVNGNGQVDPGEKGAFLVANSWGSNWGNNGFIWVSYDAFLPVSAVANGPNQGRVPAGACLNSYFVSLAPKAAHYSPRLFAEFSLTQTVRNQIAIIGGVSDVAHTSPTTTFYSDALYYKGGVFEFNGTHPGAPETGTFALDLTDLLPASSNGPQRYYLTVSDYASGNPTTLNSYSLIDPVNKQQVNCTQVPKVCDGSSVSPYIDYNLTLSAVVEPPLVNITSPSNNGNVQGTIQISVNATSSVGIARVDLYIDANVYKSDTSAPYLYSVDTTQLSNGPHQIEAIAYDTENNITQTSITVQVQNPSYPSSIFVNCGGDVATYSGVNWTKDSGYTLPSYAYTSSLPFANPVYQSQRYGRFSYNFPIANGTHTVKLKFAELVYKQPGQRVFNVVINGTQVITNLDLVNVAGYGVPYDKVFHVNVTDNNIKIDFVPVVNSAKINAIAITTP